MFFLQFTRGQRQLIYVCVVDYVSLHFQDYFALELSLTHVKGSAAVTGLLRRDLAMTDLVFSVKWVISKWAKLKEMGDVLTDCIFSPVSSLPLLPGCHAIRSFFSAITYCCYHRPKINAATKPRTEISELIAKTNPCKFVFNIFCHNNRKLSSNGPFPINLFLFLLCPYFSFY